MSAMDDLRTKLEEDRKRMSEGEGSAIVSSKNGPVGFRLIDRVIAVLEEQARQIEELRQKVDTLERNKPSLFQ